MTDNIMNGRLRILFTGASSFTGFWFVRRLAQAGHQVYATFRRSLAEYKGIRGVRVREVLQYCQPIWRCAFGTAEFMDVLAGQQEWDVLCHHAAECENYKSLDFSIEQALVRNTNNLRAVLEALISKGLRRVVLTGTVFEADEGAGTAPLRAVSPYGVSKTLTWHVVRFWCEYLGLQLGKFVIPTPFGPYEDENRFSAYLCRSWLRGEEPVIKTPLYVRDYVHVQALGDAYVGFVEGLDPEARLSRMNPSGYVEPLWAFAQRLASEMRPRFDRACSFRCLNQTDFSEPLVRINTDPINPGPSWDEGAAWDALADYYRQTFQFTATQPV